MHISWEEQNAGNKPTISLPADLAAFSLCQSFRSIQDLLILQA